MVPLMLVIHIFLGSTLAGVGVVAALTLGLDTLTPILVAAGVGFAVAFPASWAIARRLKATAS